VGVGQGHLVDPRPAELIEIAGGRRQVPLDPGFWALLSQPGLKVSMFFSNIP
jgi:hypothetical protein